MAKHFRAQRGEATCQINVTVAKFCYDEACHFLGDKFFCALYCFWADSRAGRGKIE